MEKKNRRTINKQAIVNSMGGKCCICGYNKCLAALQFHHRDPKQKKFNISKFISLAKQDYLFLRELEKVLLVCANCHVECHQKMHEKELEEIPDFDLVESGIL